MSWSEARQEPLKIARFMDLSAYLDEGNRELVPIVRDDQPLWRRRPNFAEDVACSIVHNEGKAFVPADPGKSSTPIAVPWATASELVMRLSLLLTIGLASAKPKDELDALQKVAVLVVQLSARVADQMAWIGDGDFVEERIEGQRCLLICASEVWRAATSLRDAAECLGLAGEDMAPGLDEGLLAYLTNRQERDTFLWGLEWWITDGTHL